MPPFRRNSSQSTSHLGLSAKDQKPQKTISELFATSKRPAAGLEDAVAGFAPICKRSKHLHPAPPDSPRPKALTPAEMYSFPPSPSSRTRSTNGIASSSEVIDLTGSPDTGSPAPSPKPRKPTGIIRASALKSQNGPRKLVVKNLKKAPQADPEKYYNQVWNQLDAALSAIFANEHIPYSFEELYKGVESLCRQDHAPALYKKLREKCKHNVSVRVLEPVLKSASIAQENARTLDVVVKAWSTWTDQMATVRKIFFYLDRSYLLQSQTLGSIEEMGIHLFRTQVYAHAELHPQILQGAYDLLMADRHGKLKDDRRKLLTDSVKLFHALGVYAADFEPKVLGDSEDYLLTWSEEASSSHDIAYYANECHDLLHQETSRCDAFGLDRTTRDTLERHMEDILVEQRQELVLDTDGLFALLHQGAYPVLDQVYSLLRRKRLCEKLKLPFEAYIIKQGSEIVFDEKREQEMVPRLLEFKRKLDHVCFKCFQKHEGLGHTMRESYENFINKSKRSNMTWGTDNPKPGEMIAKYVDLILKGGSKAIPTLVAPEDLKGEPAKEGVDEATTDEESEISSELDQVLELFRFVHGKAVFEAFYKRDLARRLLLGRSASADAEKMMLTRLKSECGAGFTHNLEQMFKDMEMAREEITSYRAMLDERQSKPPVDLNVNVLSASAWPTYPDITVEIPRSIQTAAASFEAHYKSKHTGRRLAWKHGLAHCQLKATFPKGNKEIVVSAFQAVVLLQFNTGDTSDPVSYAEIQAASNLDDTELKRTLQSLACAKYRVLSKNPKGRDVNTTDTFTVNQSFTDPKYRIKINQIQAKETKQENKETHERVAADRNFETQAAIVRIMKSRKTITHAELISEVIVATRSRGVLDPADIKKNIEKLIEKDYMERDETKDGRNAYSYLA